LYSPGVRLAYAQSISFPIRSLCKMRIGIACIEADEVQRE
jgi:hypothetical protein